VGAAAARYNAEPPLQCPFGHAPLPRAALARQLRALNSQLSTDGAGRRTISRIPVKSSDAVRPDRAAVACLRSRQRHVVIYILYTVAAVVGDMVPVWMCAIATACECVSRV